MTSSELKAMGLVFSGLTLIGLSSCSSVSKRGPAAQTAHRTAEEIAEAASHWRLYGGNHWQRLSDPDIDARMPAPSQECSLPGMVRVTGRMLEGPIEALQDESCAEWVDGRSTWSGNNPPRCARFNADLWRQKTASLGRKDMSFCIDKYEYPDVEGQNPVVMMTYTESAAACRAQQKRLCTDEEWTFACEGEEGLPYPYGYERSPDACNADHGWLSWDSDALFGDRTASASAAELERLWKGRPSGSMPGCVSPFGVYDLTGNVDEWTVNRISQGRYSGALKGGYWGPVRARCRPATIAHNDEHFFYQQGTRCCADR